MLVHYEQSGLIYAQNQEAHFVCLEAHYWLSLLDEYERWASESSTPSPSHPHPHVASASTFGALQGLHAIISFDVVPALASASDAYIPFSMQASLSPECHFQIVISESLSWSTVCECHCSWVCKFCLTLC